MDTRPSVRTATAIGPFRKRPTVFLRRLAVVGVLAAVAIVVWLMAVVPALVAFVIAVALAIGWCLWLEKSPENRVGRATRPSDSGRR